MNSEFDAIVVGSGVTGGWAAKELTEKGLKVLMLERGKPLEHGKDYVTEHVPPWKIPFGGKPVRDLYKRDYAVQSTSYAFDETTRHFWMKDTDQPYTEAAGTEFTWIRADVVGGKSLLWGRQVYRWSDLDFEANKRMAALPAKRRRKIEARAAAILLEELSLRDLRKALDQTQAGIAKTLGVRQDTVSRYERQSDLLLSTLRSYVRAMGGELSLLAEFPHRPPVKLRGLADLPSHGRN